MKVLCYEKALFPIESLSAFNENLENMIFDRYGYERILFSVFLIYDNPDVMSVKL